MVTDTINDVIAFVAVFTAVAAAIARYAAVLRGRDERRIEFLTALGFFVGFVLSAVILVGASLAPA